MGLMPIFDPLEKHRPMRVAAFMSGSGTNILRLLEREKELERQGTKLFQVVFIFSDRSDGRCRGESIAHEYGIAYFSYDIRRFHEIRGVKRSVKTKEGLEARKEFDQVPKKLVEAFEVDVIALGGYMSYTTLNRCVNVHPADLSIKDPQGNRKYVGDRAVYDAILAGERELRSSTIWTDEGVDTGPLLMVSEPLPVELPLKLQELKKNPELLEKVAQEHQERLKEVGDWKIFPKTIEMIAQGRFALDGDKNVYVDGVKVEEGYRLREGS
jgi:folate-dependent phosphoribosylglycinamide formyltransferase PurN